MILVFMLDIFDFIYYLRRSKILSNKNINYKINVLNIVYVETSQFILL